MPIDDGEDVCLNNEELSEAVHNVFDLSSTEQTSRYLHASIGFPTKRTWIKAIKKGNFIGWSLVTAENVRSTSQRKQYFEGGETTKDCGEYQ